MQLSNFLADLYPLGSTYSVLFVVFFLLRNKIL